MLIPVPTLVRRSASEPPQERIVGIQPEAVARLEDHQEPGVGPCVLLWCDGMERPYKVPGTVAEWIREINAECLVSEVDECEPVSYDTA